MKPQPRVVQQKPTQILSPMLSSWRLPLFFARRYLFSRKRVGAINIISGISVAGVAVGTMALVIVLSVFNGFHDLVASFFTNFDPQIEVVPATGKTAPADAPQLDKIRHLQQVAVATDVVEDQALAVYGQQQRMVTVMGVDDNFQQLTHINDILYGDGTFLEVVETVEHTECHHESHRCHRHTNGADAADDVYGVCALL